MQIGRPFYPIISLGFQVLLIHPAAAGDWPDWRGPDRDGRWNETGIVEKFTAPDLPVRWRAEIGSGYSGPTVAEGRVFVTDRIVSPGQVERVHCFNAETGEKVWSYAYDCEYRGVGYDAGPRACVVIRDGRAYSLGAMGRLFCFDAATGRIHWQHDLNVEYRIRMPTWGISATPFIYQDLIILQIGGEGAACLVALDRSTGVERWKALEDDASYATPTLIQQAGTSVLVVWTGQRIVGMNPETGELYWEHPFRQKMIINIAVPQFDGDRLFITSFFDGALMLKLDPGKFAVEPLWRRYGPDEKTTDALHSIIATPIFRGDYIYGVDSYGELRCLDARTGDRVWESLEAVPKAR